MRRIDARTTSLVRVRLHDAVVVLILVLAGIFDWLSGNPIHSLLLFAAAVALVWTALRGGLLQDGGEPQPAPPLEPSRPARRVAAPLAVTAALLFAIVVGGFGRYSWPATVPLVLLGGVAMTISWRRPVPRRTTSHAELSLSARGVAAWVSLFVALGLFELTNLLLQPTLSTDSYIHPTLSVVTDPVLASHVGRSLVLLCWLALGWFLWER